MNAKRKAMEPLQERPDEGTAEGRVLHLMAVNLFEELKKEEPVLAALAAAMQERKYATGQSIIQEGEKGKELFILIRGQASVYKTTPEGDQYKVAILNGDQHA